MVGDSKVDVLAAKAAGVTAVLFYPPCHELFYEWTTIKEAQADYVIRDFAELAEIIG
ncbi:MAG TPA: hypothetical protein VD999_04100 [Vitreimonas sp.]|nr:hypothetical protein [Vitreimonas sp.]